MAWPKDLSHVATNLTLAELTELRDAMVERPRPEFSFQPGMEFAGYFECKFFWRGNTYRLNEEFELVTSIQKLGQAPRETMNKYFECQLHGYKGKHTTVLFLVEQADGALFTERANHDIGDPINLEGYEFVRMHSNVLPIFKPV